MKIKLISFVLSLVMLASFAVACQSEPPKEQKDTEKSEYEGLVIDGEFVVVRGEKASRVAIDSASYLRRQINEKASLSLDMTTDFYRNVEDIPEKEILVGKTNRDLEFDRTTLKEGEYYIGFEGTKVIIDAYDDESLHFAVEKFANEWLTTDLGIQNDGALLMNDEICAKLNGLDISVKNSILILSQNLRNGDDGNGNDLADRQPRFLKMVQQYQPDIIGVQEDNASWKDYINQNLFKDYGIVGKSHVNCILYKRSRFDLVKSGMFWLSDTPDVASKVPSSTYNRICAWAVLKDKQTDEEILMCNTHLDHGPDSAREEQSEILVDYLAKNLSGYPTYITGDYNFEPNTVAYNTMAKSWLDAHDEAIVDKSKTKFTFPAYQGNPIKEIDFCFYNDRSTAISYYIVTDSYDGCVSDHYGVLFEFVVN